VVLVNACTDSEEVLEMAAVTRDGIRAIEFVPPQLLRQSAIASQRPVEVSVLGKIAHVRINEDNISLAKDFRLVWSPSTNSLSPYAPFYRFTITVRAEDFQSLPPFPGSEKIAVPFFVRADFWDWPNLFADASPDPVQTSMFRPFNKDG
jgi:hypothetical protein